MARLGRRQPPKPHIGPTFRASVNAYTLTADTGSFALTGQAAGLTVARTIAPAVGAFTLTGQSASLLATRTISVSAGAFTLTGQDAGLLAARLMAPAVGAFALTGPDVAFVYAPAGTYVIIADAGSFTLDGQAAILKTSRVLSAQMGEFTLTGSDADIAIASDDDRHSALRAPGTTRMELWKTYWKAQEDDEQAVLAVIRAFLDIKESNEWERLLTV